MAEQSKPADGSGADRRTVLRTCALGAAVAGVGVTAAACSTANSMPQGSGAQQGQAAGPTGPVDVATTSQVQVGSGYVNTEYAVVVTQPSAGDYKAFTAVCTHAQCLVDGVSGNVIQCPCHGSQYSAKDGSVITGPATQPLASKTIKVSGKNIVYEP